MTIANIIDIIGIIAELALSGVLLVLASKIYSLDLEVEELAHYIGKAFDVSDDDTQS